MEYIRLNPQYALRHNTHCSYIVKRNGSYDSLILPGTNSFAIVPKYIGYIISLLGICAFDENVTQISRALAVDYDILKSFLVKLIENDKPLIFNTGSDEVVFPKRLLTKQNNKRELNDRSIEFASLPLMKECFKPERPSFPLNINLMITNKCSTNCAYCYANRDIQEELSTEGILNLIDTAQKSGVVNLTLTGGDLLMRQDSLDIFRACANAQFSLFVSTKTPKSESYVQELKQIGVNEIQFSLDSARSPTLESLLGVSKSYLNRVRVFFTACHKYGISLSIRSVLTNKNATLDEVRSLYRFLCEYDNVTKWTLTPMFYSEYTSSRNLYPENNQLEEVYSFTSKLKTPFPIFYNKIGDKGYSHVQYPTIAEYLTRSSTCLANTTSLSILCDGTCTLCEMLYKNPLFMLGNVNESSLREIWNSSKALSIYNGSIPGEVATPCSSCQDILKCKGGIFKHVCYVDVIKVHGARMGGHPDPKCPKCKKWDLIL